jgi:hypothetical protein
MFIILSWFGIIFNLIEFVLRGIMMNTMHSNIYCTNSSTISCPSIVFSVTPLRRSAPAYILALRDLFLTVRERMSISCLNSLLRRYCRLRALYSVMSRILRTRGLPSYILPEHIDHSETIREFINVLEAEVQKLEADQLQLGACTHWY